MRMAGRFSRRVRGYVKRMVFRLWIVRPESARFFLDEAEHFRHNRRASVATLRELFAFGPECRSRSLRNQCSPRNPQLAAAQELRPSRDAQNPGALDADYYTIRTAM